MHRGTHLSDEPKKVIQMSFWFIFRALKLIFGLYLRHKHLNFGLYFKHEKINRLALRDLEK